METKCTHTETYRKSSTYTHTHTDSETKRNTWQFRLFFVFCFRCICCVHWIKSYIGRFVCSGRVNVRACLSSLFMVCFCVYVCVEAFVSTFNSPILNTGCLWTAPLKCFAYMFGCRLFCSLGQSNMFFSLYPSHSPYRLMYVVRWIRHIWLGVQLVAFFFLYSVQFIGELNVILCCVSAICDFLKCVRRNRIAFLMYANDTCLSVACLM